MNLHNRFIQFRKEHFKNMMYGYGMKERVPFKIARIYYSIAHARANEYFEKYVTNADYEMARLVIGRDCTFKEVLEIKNWIKENEYA